MPSLGVCLRWRTVAKTLLRSRKGDKSLDSSDRCNAIFRYEVELDDWKEKYTSSLGESAQAKEKAELLG